jgi:hypothetical protein
LSSKLGKIGEDPFIEELLGELRLQTVEAKDHHSLGPGSSESAAAPEKAPEDPRWIGESKKESRQEGGKNGKKGADQGDSSAWAYVSMLNETAQRLTLVENL